jgi:hypothetical protein
MRSIQSLIISQDDTEEFIFCREWKEERNEKRGNIKESRTTIVCSGDHELNNRRARLSRDMCLKEARRQARLRDIVRHENLYGDASNGDSSGRHGGFVRETRKRQYGVGTILEHE